MTIFLRLVLAHFLAEFVFLRNSVFSMKSEDRISGHALHGAVYALCIVFTCGKYLNLPWIELGNFTFYGWELLVPMVGVHLLSDVLNRADICRAGNYNTLYFLSWQMIELLIFFLIFPVIPEQEMSQFGLYSDEIFTIALGMIFTAYFTMMLLFYVEKDLQCGDGPQTSDEKFVGILYRVILFFLLLIPSLWSYIAGVSWVVFVFSVRAFKVIDISPLRFWVGTLCSALAALAVRMLF